MSTRVAIIVAVLAAAATVGIIIGSLVVFGSDAGLAVTWLVIVAAIAAGAFRWGRWKAVTWLGAVPWASASLLADAAWWSGLWDRSSEYEPLPLSMFVIPFLVPAFSAAAACGVAARRAANGRRRSAASRR